jgi:hypothetical protein
MAADPFEASNGQSALLNLVRALARQAAAEAWEAVQPPFSPPQRIA